MEQKPGKAGGAAARDARLKSALKANLGRRKAQARARAAAGGADDDRARTTGEDRDDRESPEQAGR